MKIFNHVKLPQLDFDLKAETTDSGRLYATPTGEKYKSITTVLGNHNKQAIMEWRKRVGEEEANKISSKAAGRGTRIHSLCEQYLLNKEIVPNMFDVEMWQNMKPVLHSIDNIHALEQPLYSDHLEVAGTVDCIGEYNGKMSVIDFKTSKRNKTRDDIHDYFIQCSAYAVAFEEMTGNPVSRLVVIMGVDNEQPLIFQERRDDWVSEFKKLRAEYKRIKGI